MKRTFLVNSMPHFKGWETCFRALMEKSETFRIIFQGRSDVFDEEGLNAGKREFLSLPSITITPYKGMENSIEAAGELTVAARELFLTFMEPSFEGWKSDLWSFQFLRGNDLLLRVDDFTVGWLFLEENDVEDLLARGVAGLDLLEIENFSTEAPQSDIKVLSWSKDELSSLGDQLHAKLADLLQTPPSDHLT